MAFAYGGGYQGINLIMFMEDVESTYGYCSCPPAGGAWQALTPAASPSGLLFFAGLVLFPVALALTILSLFSWKVMVGAGLVGSASSSLWIGDVLVIRSAVAAQLDKLSGVAGGGTSWSVYPQTGSFVALVASLALVAGYILSKQDRLEWPH